MNLKIQSKSEWRKRIKEQLKSLSAEGKIELEKNLCTQIETFMMNQSGLWSCYFPLPDEADILSVLHKCPHIDWCFPRVESDGELLTFWRVAPQHLNGLMDKASKHDLKDPFWMKGQFGVIQPRSDNSGNSFKLVALNEIKGFLVPGLAFDKTGTRLGRGKGYFDRALEKTTGVRAGIGFAFQFTEEVIPSDSWDVKMNVVITDCGIHNCDEKRE